MKHRIFVLIILLFIARLTQGQDTTRVSLLWLGDIMQHDSNIAAAYQPVLKRYDYTSCFEWIAPVLRSADLTIGNFELTLAGAPYKGYPQFSAPDALAVQLKNIGIDVLVTANNHCVDRGRDGLERTIQVLDSLEILHTGTFIDTTVRRLTYPLVIEKNGITFSLLNYTYGTNGLPVKFPNHVNLIDTTTISRDILTAKRQRTDVIIIYFHWGGEYQSLPNESQKKLAEWCFNRGVKVVIGAHPHVLQPMHWLRETNQFVAYSLGNFVSGQRPRYRDGGALLWLEFEKVKRDSLTTTRISQAEYELEWVYKKPSIESFQLLPARYFEHDTVSIPEASMQKSRDVFIADSRALYDKHNRNVAERRVEQEQSYYRLAITCQFEATRDERLKELELMPQDFSTRWFTSKKISTLEEALVLLEHVKPISGIQAVSVQRFVER